MKPSAHQPIVTPGSHPPASRLPAFGTKTVRSTNERKTNAGNTTQQIRAQASCKPPGRVRERDMKTKSIIMYQCNKEIGTNAQPHRSLSETTGGSLSCSVVGASTRGAPHGMRGYFLGSTTHELTLGSGVSVHACKL